MKNTFNLSFVFTFGLGLCVVSMELSNTHTSEEIDVGKISWSDDNVPSPINISSQGQILKSVDMDLLYTDEEIHVFCAHEMKEDPDLTMTSCQKLVLKGKLKLPIDYLLKNCTRLPPRLNSTEEMPKTLDQVIAEGMDQLNLKEQKSVILMVGNSGGGKTTLTQIIAGDLSRLHAVLPSNSNKTVIIDDENRIGFPTIESKTLVPEFVEDAEGTTVIYDCPGFSDNRGPVTEIAANYFVSKVTGHVENVKVVFVALHSSLVIGNDRFGFDKMVKHGVKFLRNIDKFKNGIGLVVTKVNSFSDQGTFIPDDHLLSDIIDFLTQYIQTQRTSRRESILTSRTIEIDQKIQLVNTFLQQDINGTYYKIIISRSPQRCGPLNTIRSILRTKSNLIKLFQNLQFVRKTSSDFGFSLGDETVNKISYFVSQINFKMQNYTKTIVDDWKKLWVLGNPTGAELSKAILKLDVECNALKVLEEIKKSIPMKDFIKNIQDTFSSLHFQIQSNFSVLVHREEELLNFLEYVTEKSIERRVDLWLSPISDIIKELEISKRRLLRSEFLAMVEIELSKYSFQSTKPINYQISNFTQGMDLIEKSVQILNLDKQQIMDNFQKYALDSEQIKIVEIINSALEAPILKYTNYYDTLLTVTGCYVKFSDFIEDKFPKNCWFCRDLKIYAGCGIFIDTDINGLGRFGKISIIAPKWEIIGTRVLNLNGMNGRKPFNSIRFGGENGEPGTNGGYGTNFFGLGDVFVSGNNLRVLANGGRGGNGEDGVEGNPGMDGKKMTFERFPKCINPRKVHQVCDVWNLGYEGWFGYKDGHCTMYGSRGSKGGEGGNGGVGGYGGYPGHVEIRSTGGNSNIIVERERGIMGQPGRGGAGGSGGKTGDSLKCFLYTSADCGIKNCRSISREKLSLDGDSGTSNGNTVGLIVPTSTYYYARKPNVSLIINQYKELVSSRNKPLGLVRFIQRL